jgi:predicted ArsR family transcriptional regulator
MTAEEMLLELEKALTQADTPDDAVTTGELADLLGVGDAAIRKRLKKLSKTGVPRVFDGDIQARLGVPYSAGARRRHREVILVGGLQEIP